MKSHRLPKCATWKNCADLNLSFLCATLKKFSDLNLNAKLIVNFSNESDFTFLTHSTQSNLFPNFVCFFYVETHKVSTSTRGGFQVLLHKIFLEQVHSARLSCTADARPLTGFEKGPNLAENRVEYVLLTT